MLIHVTHFDITVVFVFGSSSVVKILMKREQLKKGEPKAEKAEPKKPKEKKTGHQDQPNPQEIAQYSVPHRPKRKLQERQEMYPSPKQKNPRQKFAKQTG
jgi:hypothetical protein